MRDVIIQSNQNRELNLSRSKRTAFQTVVLPVSYNFINMINVRHVYSLWINSIYTILSVFTTSNSTNKLLWPCLYISMSMFYHYVSVANNCLYLPLLVFEIELGFK